jgi:hypothetical protein
MGNKVAAVKEIFEKFCGQFFKILLGVQNDIDIF